MRAFAHTDFRPARQIHLWHPIRPRNLDNVVDTIAKYCILSTIKLKRYREIFESITGGKMRLDNSQLGEALGRVNRALVSKGEAVRARAVLRACSLP